MEFIPSDSGRAVKTIVLNFDFVVVGGGLAGVCAAISAARRGVRTCLIQDRPVLGGNASSEVRVWALGATSHMGNNNRYSREGGLIDEILIENQYRNKEGNPILFDMLLMDKVLAEKNISLYLNTAVFDVASETAADGTRRVKSVTAFCPSSELRYEISGSLFADCSGDGILSHLAGVPYRIGAEAKEVYNEGFAPDVEKYGELMGDSIFFYMKDTGKPVKYVAPYFALKDVEKHISKVYNRNYFNTGHHGCKYWWLEYGGRLDTVHDTEKIKFEIWKVVYGIWDYIKNSGKFPEMETWTLEWAGVIPGKRESRRMKGYYTLNQNDIVHQTCFYDAVSFGGWAVDLHPADGVYADGSACNQWHSKGIYQIPYRCFLGPEVENLWFGGRIISASHVANGSVRVMLTAAHGGAVIGTAAALCLKHGVLPAHYVDESNVRELQHALEETGHFIPDFAEKDPSNLLNEAEIRTSSEYMFNGFMKDSYKRLIYSSALMIPVHGRIPAFTIKMKASCPTTLKAELRISAKPVNFTPEQVLAAKEIALAEGEQEIRIDFDSEIAQQQYAFIIFMANNDIEIGVSEGLSTGIVTVLNQINEAVSNAGRQTATADNGFESFEFWCPERRPQAKNLAIRFEEPLRIYKTENLHNAYKRPFYGSNAWAACPEDETPALDIAWTEEKKIKEIILFFDTDFDFASETVQMGHHEDVLPFCVNSYRIYDGAGNLLHSIRDNHQATNRIILPEAIHTSSLRIELDHPEHAPASLFHIMIK